jgi:hypothetical protein
MSNISIKHDLKKLAGATVMPVGKNSTQCIVIPIEMAGLFYNGTGGVYLDSTAIPLTNPKDGSKDTHIVKQQISKEKYAAMTDEERKAQPIIGNAIVWDSQSTAKTETKTNSAPPNWL